MSTSQRAARAWDAAKFDSVFDEFVVAGHFFEDRDYYPRYKSRYRGTLRYMAELSLPQPARVLDIGGGQFAMLAKAMWGDEPYVLDVSDSHADYLRERGVTHGACDLVHDEPPDWRVDVIVFAEVIEHLPIPPHLVLEKLLRMLDVGGYLITTTPNFFRLRNVVRLLQCRDFTARFAYPPRGQGTGHIMEYSPGHLRYQLERAGFDVEAVHLTHFPHQPVALSDRLMYWLGRPLLLREGWRDNLVAIARRAGD